MATKDHRGNTTSRAAVVALAFALICTGLVAALTRIPVARGDDGVPSSEPEYACPCEATRMALEDTARADLAIRERNFGAAHIYVQRARVRLEAAMSESSVPVDTVDSEAK